MINSKIKYFDIFRNIPAIYRGFAVVLLTLVISFLDIITPSYVPFTGFYLIPIFISIWYFDGVSILILIVLISICVRFYVNLNDMPGNVSILSEMITLLSDLFVFIGAALMSFELKNIIINNEKKIFLDNLTRINNRRGFHFLANRELKVMQRLGYPVTFVLLDLDNFKHLNDTQGHAKGDQLLKEFGQILIQNLREIDIYGRLGGDEFAIILLNTDLDQAKNILSRLHSTIQQALIKYNDSIGCSIGAIHSSSDSVFDLKILLHKADQIMYEVKNNGKNNFKIIT